MEFKDTEEYKEIKIKLISLESLWPLVKEKVKACNNILVEFTNIKMKLDELQKENSTLAENLQKNTKEIQEQIQNELKQQTQQQINEYKTYSKSEFDKCFNKIVDYEKLNYDRTSDIIISMSEVNDKFKDLSLNQSNFAKLKQISDIEIKLSNLDSKIDKSSDEYQLLLKSSVKNDEIFKNKFMSLNSWIDGFTEIFNVSLKKNEDQLEKHIKDLNEFKNQQDKKFSSFKEELIKLIDSSIKSIPKPIIPTLDEAKSHMCAQLEPVILDAKNANLRSTNVETKLFIIEKKIEQIKLMLDKLQAGI